MNFNIFYKKCYLIVCFVLLSSPIFAQTNIQIEWSVSSAGGGKGASSTFRLFDAIGLNMFGAMASESYKLSGGISTPTKVNRLNNAQELPGNFDLKQNYPNPFNPTTNIQFDLPEPAQVEILIYNVLGQKVKTLVDNQFQAGTHVLIWDATNDDGMYVGTGTYIFTIRVKSKDKILFQGTKKMALLK